MNNNKTVIVGAGMAGLTAAAYLAEKKFDVLLVDKNDRSGGLVGTFEKNGFHFDTGPRALINSGIIKPILNDLDIQGEFLENRISVGIEDKIFQVESMADLQEYQRVLDSLYPENKDEIKTIIHYIRLLSEYTKVLYEFDNPNFSDQMRNTNYIFNRLLPWMVKFLRAMKKLNDYGMPMETFLGKITENLSLIDVVTQHYFRKTPANFALGYFYVYMDYFYPKGGTGALNDLLRARNLELGTEIKLNTQITQVIPAESRIVDSQGESYQYENLIWAGDLKSFYRYVNTTGLDPKSTAKLNSEADRVISSKGAESVFMIFLAVDRPPSYFKDHGGEHIFYTPSREGLGAANREERENLIRDFDHKSKEDILDWVDRYIKLNTYEISIPVLRDSTLAPEGQTGVMISCLFDFEVFKKVEEAGWYDEFKQTIENRIVTLISETLYEDMEKDILFRFSSSPITISKLAGTSEGAITGWSFEKEPPVISKLSEIPKSVLTPISNIFQAGQWAYAPAGVPIAMLTGWYASQKIIKSTKS